MVSDERGKQLHDRATRGQVLSPKEQMQLKAWYEAQDRAEMAELGLPVSETTASLRTQVDAVLVQLATTTRRIQELVAENETLRHEIAVLRRQWTERAILQPA